MAEVPLRRGRCFSSHAFLAQALLILLCAEYSFAQLPRANKQTDQPENNQNGGQIDFWFITSPNPLPEKQQDASEQQTHNWHEWFWPPNWSGWALVAIGGIGARYALRTLRSIERQTAAIIEGQRPHIAAKPHGNPSHDLMTPDAPHMQIELINCGLTAAHEFCYETWIEVLPAPFADFTAMVEHVDFSGPVVLSPNHQPLIANIPVSRGIVMDDHKRIRKGELIVCVRVRAKYRDAFSPSRCVDFGFMVYGDGLGYLPKYNGESPKCD
jgi:hypothetical protein